MDYDSQSVTAGGPSVVDVVVCRGCCCGTERKHPDVDHALQGLLLREAALENGGTFRYSDCLGPCEHSNVVVVRNRNSAAQWFGEMLDISLTKTLAEWLVSNAQQPLPQSLAARRFSPRSDNAITPRMDDFEDIK